MNYEELKETIVDNVFENTSQQITGQALQDTLIAMVDSLGAGYQFIGIATPDTNPGTIDHKAFWLTSQLGTYTHMGGVSLSSAGELGVIYYDGEGYSIDTIPTNFPYIASATISQDGKTIVLTDQDGDETSLNIFTDAERTKLSDLPTNAELNEDFAKKDGFYETLGAGYARSLLGTGASVPAEFTARPSGGTADIASGVATIKNIKGNTIVWNQRISHGSFDAIGDWATDQGTLSVADNICTAIFSTTQYNRDIRKRSLPYILSHKYLASCDFFADMNCGVAIQLGTSSNPYKISQNVEANTWTMVNGIVTNINGAGAYFGLTTTSDYSVQHTVKFRNIYLIDLTQMFGAGNEPASVAEFKAIFPNDYYPYTAGELLSLTAENLVTEGFNAFDKATGKARVLALTPSAGQAGSYQITGSYTSITQDGEAITPDTNGFFTPKEGEVVVVGGDDTTCIHIVHSGSRNGDYEPYWQATKNLNLTTLKGKLNGEGESVTIFPEGMRSAGSAADELNGNEAIVRVGAVDLGTLNWLASSAESNRFVAVLPSASFVYVYAERLHVRGICSIYSYDTANGGWGAPMTDQTFALPTAFSNAITVKDSSYTTAAAFKSAMSGVMLHYQLATPQVYTLDEPVSASYRVDDFGTESIAPLTDEDGNPATAPMVADIVYGPNVQDAIRRMPTLYLSIADYKAGIGNLATALGTSLDKTIAVEWGGENDSVPTFTITDNA